MPASNAAPPRIPGYTYIRTLGEGSTASVYLYQQRTPNRIVAVKVSKDSVNPRAAAQFTREADTMARLSSHPNIMSIYGAGVTSSGQGYIVFEYAPNGTYKEITQAHPLTCDQMLDLGVKLAGALFTAHRAGVIHHDIKTSNVLVNAQGLPVLADFGIASGIYDKRFTGYSLPWAPPEVLTGHVGQEAADIYSLAATLYATLTGRSPFEYGYHPRTPNELKELILDKPLPALNRPDVPADVERVLRKAMAKDPDDRYYSALQFAREMQRVQQAHFGHMTPVVAEGQPPYPSHRAAVAPGVRTTRPTERRWVRPLAVAAGVVAAIAAVSLAFAFVIIPRSDSHATGSQATVRTPGTGEGDGSAAAGPDATETTPVPSPSDLYGAYDADGTVTFHWTNPDPKDGDTYAWQPAEGSGEGTDGQARMVRETQVTVDADPDAAQTCIQVSIVRADRRMSDAPATACAAKPVSGD
ncbi:serine/threonine-protein kinase [Bifidobacterium saguinibicoloris]|uniref:serine/threonine-protein kinase n=1 Tax=Bifidobacterium saguinibicoloris TaxID=2834433 RepID=UPI001C562EF8|nr:serine/threonine-protein kinase [Bifidobacterium saguinibicoloris]MBW3081425.1 serine/threonine protein kinase [Bifidobacterium saguinibicoloris]